MITQLEFPYGDLPCEGGDSRKGQYEVGRRSHNPFKSLKGEEYAYLE
jgi:hypothetical protein